MKSEFKPTEMRQKSENTAKKRRPWSGPWWILALLLGGCGSPFAGGWAGTMDVGPILAHTITVQMPPEGLEGDLRVQTPEGDKDYRICSGTLTNDQFELSFDRLHPDCTAPKDGKRDLHVLRGTLGEGVFFGEVYRGDRRIGFFRAFRKPKVVDVVEG